MEKSRCTGCTACVAVCPLDAIVMKQDSEGFLYPEVDVSRCVNCGKCHKVCPVDQEPTSVALEKAYYATADEGLRKQSSSGGVFSLLAEQILKDGGVVFGCAMTEDCGGAHHIGVDSEEKMWQLRGSKYVQSALENSLWRARLPWGCRKIDDGGRNLSRCAVTYGLEGLPDASGTGYGLQGGAGSIP